MTTSRVIGTPLGITPGSIFLLFANKSVTGNTVATTSAETAFASAYVVPANSLAVGDVLEIACRGHYGTASTGTPTLTLRIRYGASIVVTTGPMLVQLSQANTQGWSFNGFIHVWAIGASGTLDCQGDEDDIVNTTTFTMDTTADQAIQVSAHWSVANASNTITLRQMTVRKLFAP